MYISAKLRKPEFVGIAVFSLTDFRDWAKRIF